MNWDQIQGRWMQMKGQVKEKWGRMTNDDIDQIEGQRDKLVGKIQEVYGKTREEAEKDAEAFSKSCR